MRWVATGAITGGPASSGGVPGRPPERVNLGRATPGGGRHPTVTVGPLLLPPSVPAPRGVHAASTRRTSPAHGRSPAHRRGDGAAPAPRTPRPRSTRTAYPRATRRRARSPRRRRPPRSGRASGSGPSPRCSAPGGPRCTGPPARPGPASPAGSHSRAAAAAGRAVSSARISTQSVSAAWPEAYGGVVRLGGAQHREPVAGGCGQRPAAAGAAGVVQHEVEVDLGGAVRPQPLGPYGIRARHRPFVLGQCPPFLVPGPAPARRDHRLALTRAGQQDRQALVAAPTAEAVGSRPAQRDPEDGRAQPPGPQDDQLEEPERGDFGGGGGRRRQRGLLRDEPERRTDGPGFRLGRSEGRLAYPCFLEEWCDARVYSGRSAPVSRSTTEPAPVTPPFVPGRIRTVFSPGTATARSARPFRSRSRSRRS